MTRRIKRTDDPKESPVSPTRSQSVKAPNNFDRTKISLPIALVSTTNMLSYNAPDISTLRNVSSSTSLSHSSADDSDHSVSTRSRASSHGSRDTTLTDASSVESSPSSPAPNHLSGYFSSAGKQLKKSASTTSLKQVKEEPVEAACYSSKGSFAQQTCTRATGAQAISPERRYSWQCELAWKRWFCTSLSRAAIFT